MMQIISCAEAKAAGKRKYFSGKPCPKGHIAERHITGTCVECKRLIERSPEARARMSEYLKEYRAKNRAKLLAGQKAYYDQNCEKLKADQRKRRSDNPDVYRTRDKSRDPAKRSEIRKRHYNKNRPAILERRRRQYAEQSDRIKEMVTRYRRANPEKVSASRRAGVSRRRARMKNVEGFFRASDVWALFASQNGQCNGCKADLNDNYHIDHIMPVSRGGTNWPVNLQLLCAPCNLSKGAKTMDEWLAQKRS